MIKKSSIEIEVFRSRLHVRIGTNAEVTKEAQHVFPDCDFSKFDGSDAFVVSNNTEPYMFLKKGYTADTLVHECVHAASKILSAIGVKPDFHNEECHAYLIGHLFDKISNSK